MLTTNVVGRWGWVATGLTLGSLLMGACGGKDDEPPPGTGTGNTGNSTSRGGTAGKGGGTSDGGMSGDMGTGDTGTGGTGTGGTGGTGGSVDTDVLAPVVKITSPAAEDDPNSKVVIVTDEVDVVCSAKPSSADGAEAVDPSTVVIDMLDADRNVVDTLVPTEDPTGVFTARFLTTKISDNGVIGFRCSAGDKSEPVRTGTNSIETFIDHGPSIEFSEPAQEDLAVPLGPLKITFKVKERPVAKGDKGSHIEDVSMTVRDVPFELDEADGEYTATVNLKDGNLFPNVPTGSVPIIVEAGNRRSPKPAVRSEIRRVDVDGAGPQITITSPVEPFVVGNKVQLVFTATDAQSGVNPDTVVVYINKVPYRFEPGGDWSVVGDTYTFTFDQSQIANSEVQATLAVSAMDRVGNQSEDETIVVYLDNQPPIVDLDPAPVRESNTEGNCSAAFDPVGPLSANDLDVVYQVQKFRALVDDQTNAAAGQHNFKFAGPNQDSVLIRIQAKPELGLLWDKSGDGVCDELLEDDGTADHEKLPVNDLVGIMPMGAPWFGSSGNEEDPDLASEFPPPSTCTYKGDEKAPDRLCPPLKSDDMSRVIPWDVDETIPMIYGIAPDSVGCTGLEWEIGFFVKEGWFCAAARAEDTVGNVGVSRPLRLCFDDGVDPPPACANPQNDPPPSCLIDCTLPPAWPDHAIIVDR